MKNVDKRIKELSVSLLGQATRKGINLDDAQDLAQEAFMKAIAHYDEGLGQFDHFIRRIMSNLIIDHLRRIRPVEPSPGNDPETAEQDDPLKILLLIESITTNREFLNRLGKELSMEDQKFLNILGQTASEMEKVIVSEAARRCGLTREQGWNAFRRIQRAADRLHAEVSAFRHIDREEPHPFRRPMIQEPAFLRSKFISSIRAAGEVSPLYDKYTRMNAFFERLSSEQITLLNKLIT